MIQKRLTRCNLAKKASLVQREVAANAAGGIDPVPGRPSAIEKATIQNKIPRFPGNFCSTKQRNKVRLYAAEQREERLRRHAGGEPPLPYLLCPGEHNRQKQREERVQRHAAENDNRWTR
ncbi:hypothetical protein DW094_11385 [Ruminococcaceae bacterium AM07-15]|nr:hypothetical protein DW094_11385 [Ruminococcaceae bacterium AM07-15]